MEENQNTIPIQNPVPEQPPVTPLPPVEKPKPKFPTAIIIGIIIFLLIAGSAAGFYVFKQQKSKTVVKPAPSVIPGMTRNSVSPTPDPTANWKTYANNKYNFSIKYPPNITLDDKAIKYGTAEHLVFFQYLPANENEECVQIHLSVLPINQYENLEAWVKKQYPNNTYGNRGASDGGGGPNFTPPPTQLFPYINSVNKDITGYLVDGSTILIKENTHLFLWESPGCSPGQDLTELPKTMAIIDQILSTFKFADSQTINTSDWKTYSGNAIEFKYPPNGKIITSNSTDIYIYGDTKPYFTFKVNVQDNVKNLETTQVVDNLISDLKNNKNAPWAKSQADQMQQSMKDYTTGQIRGIKLQSFDEGYPQKFGEVIMVKSNKIYAFTIGNGSGGGVSDEDEIRLDHILSTFKFTN